MVSVACTTPVRERVGSGSYGQCEGEDHTRLRKGRSERPDSSTTGICSPGNECPERGQSDGVDRGSLRALCVCVCVRVRETNRMASPPSLNALSVSS